MVATGADALSEVELANAAYISAFKGRTVEMPVDADEMERLLAKLERERSAGRGMKQRAKSLQAVRKLTGK